MEEVELVDLCESSDSDESVVELSSPNSSQDRTPPQNVTSSHRFTTPLAPAKQRHRRVLFHAKTEDAGLQSPNRCERSMAENVIHSGGQIQQPQEQSVVIEQRDLTEELNKVKAEKDRFLAENLELKKKLAKMRAQVEKDKDALKRESSSSFTVISSLRESLSVAGKSLEEAKNQYTQKLGRLNQIITEQAQHIAVLRAEVQQSQKVLQENERLLRTVAGVEYQLVGRVISPIKVLSSRAEDDDKRRVSEMAEASVVELRDSAKRRRRCSESSELDMEHLDLKQSIFSFELESTRIQMQVLKINKRSVDSAGSQSDLPKPGI